MHFCSRIFRMNRRICVKMVLFAVVFVALCRYCLNTKSSIVPQQPINWLKFAPKHAFTECEELFSSSTEAADFRMSVDFNNGINEFLHAVNISNPKNAGAGHSYPYKKYYLTLHYLAKELEFVKTVCETGFNAGHSAFNFLSSKPSVTLHTFDLGIWGYSRPMSDFLKLRYASRFNVYFGDSTKTLPAFTAYNAASVECDLFHVDGGHDGTVPLKDLENFSKLANPKNNLVFMDNVNYKDVGAAWNKMVESGMVRELLRCKMHHPREDEMAIGTYTQPISIV